MPVCISYEKEEPLSDGMCRTATPRESKYPLRSTQVPQDSLVSRRGQRVVPYSAINNTPRLVLGGARIDNSTTSPSSIFKTVELETKPVAKSFIKYGIKTAMSPFASKLTV